MDLDGQAHAHVTLESGRSEAFDPGSTTENPPNHRQRQPGTFGDREVNDFLRTILPEIRNAIALSASPETESTKGGPRGIDKEQQKHVTFLNPQVSNEQHKEPAESNVLAPVSAKAPSGTTSASRPGLVNTHDRRTDSDTRRHKSKKSALEHPGGQPLSPQTKADAEEVLSAWSTCAARVREHDIVMLKRWQDEMDTLLIFAGLSSAVFTAFVIESWPMLQADPTTVTTQILLRISQQLGSLTVNTAFVNSTVPPFSSMEGLELPTAPSSPSVRINILWFFSLTLSLVSALGSILIKQWVREYSTIFDTSHPQDGMRLRQLRYDGLKRWGVPQMITLLPMLLQLAIALFLCGLLDLLWRLDRTVAIALTALISASLGGVIATILWPSFSPDCAYKSPAAWAFLKTSLVYRGVMGRCLELLSRCVILVESYIGRSFGVSSRIASTARYLLTTFRRCKSWSDHDMITLRILEKSRSSQQSHGFTMALTGRALVWVCSHFSDYGVSTLMRPCIDALDADQRANVIFTIIIRQLGFHNLHSFRTSLKYDGGLIVRNQWFWGSKAKQIGQSHELQLLVDLAPLAVHMDGRDSEISLLDIVLLLQQLVPELPRRSAEFDAKYLRLLSGDLWTLDLTTEFGMNVQKAAARALLGFSKHDIRPRVDSDTLVRLLKLVSQIQDLSKAGKQHHTHAIFRDIISGTLELLRSNRLPSYGRPEGVTTLLAVRRAVEALAEISFNENDDGKLAYPLEVREEWFSIILHVAKRHKDILSPQFTKILNQGLRKGAHRETPAVRELLEIPYLQNTEKPLLKLACAVGEALDGEKSYPRTKSVLVEISRDIRSNRRHAALAKAVDPTVKLIRFIQENSELSRNDRHGLVLQAIVLLDELARSALAQTLEGSTFMSEYASFLAHLILYSSSPTLKWRCANSLQLLSFGEQFNMDPVAAGKVVQASSRIPMTAPSAWRDERELERDVTTAALRAISICPGAFEGDEVASKLRILLERQAVLAERNNQENVRCEIPPDCLLMIARARKELLPLRLVKALHAADSLGLVDRTPLGIWLPWHVLLPFNVEERKTPAITLLMRLYRAELGMESPVQQSAAGPERPPDPSNVVLDHISSSPQKDNRNTSEFFKAADVELEGWISGFNVGYRPLESGQVSVDAGVTGNPVDMDVTEAFRRAWFQVFVRNAHNRNNYLVPAMIERLYEEDVESRTQQMNHSRLYPEEGSQDVGTLEDLDGVLAEAPPPSDGLGDVPIMDEEFSPLPTADHGTYTSSNNHTVGVELEYPGTQEVSDGPAADSNTGVAPQDIADLHGFITELLHEPEETSNIGNDTQGSVQEKVMDPQRDSASDSDPSTPKRSQHLDAPNGPVGVISIKQTAGDDLSPALGEAASSVNRIAF